MVGDRNLLLRAARTQRCAGEGELAFGLTKHGGRIAGGEFWGRLGVCLLFCRAGPQLAGLGVAGGGGGYALVRDRLIRDLKNEKPKPAPGKA
jgi:hypothetical protein